MSEPSLDKPAEFAAGAHAQSALVAASEHESDDQAFLDAVSWGYADTGSTEAASED